MKIFKNLGHKWSDFESAVAVLHEHISVLDDMFFQIDPSVSYTTEEIGSLLHPIKLAMEELYEMTSTPPPGEASNKKEMS